MLATVLVAGGLAVSVVNAQAQGGNTFATATPITPGQLETGNDADNTPIPAFQGPTLAYPSWWALTVVKGDVVTVSWWAQSPDAGLAIWQAGVVDPGSPTGVHAVQGEGNGYVDASTGIANKIKFKTTKTGVMPFDIENENDYQTPTPPGPYSFTVDIEVPPPATPLCAPSGGGLGKRLLSSLKCTAEQTKLEVQCGIGIASLIFLPLRSLKLIEAAKTIAVIDQLPGKVQPVARLLYDIAHARFSRNAPAGFRNGAEAVKTIENVHKAYQLIELLPDLAHAVSKADFSEIALDLDEIAGLRSCVEGVANAVSR